MVSATLFSAPVLLSVAKAAPTKAVFAVTGPTDPASVEVAFIPAPGEAAAIAAGTLTAQTAAQAAMRAIRDVPSIRFFLDQDYKATASEPPSRRSLGFGK
jgi:hypothetical protein